MIIPDGHAPARKAARKGSRRRHWLIGLAAAAAVLIGIRAALPPAILHFANGKLDRIPAYEGHIGDVDLAILRGAYQIEGVELRKVQGASSIPFFSADVIDLSVEWSALFRGKLVGEIIMQSPRLNFVVAESEKASQTSIDSSWEDRGRELFPLDINRFEIHDGRVRFRDLTRTPKVDIRLEDLEGVAKGLTTRPRPGEDLPATVHLTGKAQDHAKLRLDMELEPLAKLPTFDMDAELTGLRLATLNDFLKAYAKVDAEGGTFSLFTEVAAEDGRFKGYVKPLLKDVRIFSPGKKDEGGILETAWEALVAGVENVLENKPRDQLASEIPLSGRFTDPSAGVWSSVWSLLKNGFVRALRPSLRHDVDFGDVTGGKKVGITPAEAAKAKAKAEEEG